VPVPFPCVVQCAARTLLVAALVPLLAPRAFAQIDFEGPVTYPGSASPRWVATGDLDGDGRMDVVQGQGEHKTATDERVFSGRGLPRDTAPPSITRVHAVTRTAAATQVRARVHDRKSPSLTIEWKRVVVEFTGTAKREQPMRWYGEYLWVADWPNDVPASAPYRVCATDAAGNSACADPAPPAPAGKQPGFPHDVPKSAATR
jgi:hypothetical protein